MSTPPSGEYLPGQSLYDSPVSLCAAGGDGQRREFDSDINSFGHSDHFRSQCDESSYQEQPINFMQLVALVQEQKQLLKEVLTEQKDLKRTQEEQCHKLLAMEKQIQVQSESSSSGRGQKRRVTKDLTVCITTPTSPIDVSHHPPPPIGDRCGNGNYYDFTSRQLTLAR